MGEDPGRTHLDNRSEWFNVDDLPDDFAVQTEEMFLMTGIR
jgi:hypothetical protein